eukprot:04389_5
MSAWLAPGSRSLSRLSVSSQFRREIVPYPQCERFYPCTSFLPSDAGILSSQTILPFCVSPTRSRCGRLPLQALSLAQSISFLYPFPPLCAQNFPSTAGRCKRAFVRAVSVSRWRTNLRQKTFEGLMGQVGGRCPKRGQEETFAGPLV